MKSKGRIFLFRKPRVSTMGMHPAHQPLNVLRLLIVGIPLVVVREQERRLKSTKVVTFGLAVSASRTTKTAGDLIQVALRKVTELSVGR